MTTAIVRRRKRVILSDAAPTVELYPPRMDDPPPVPDRSVPMCSARYLLAERGITVTPSTAPGRRRNWSPGIELVSRARWIVPLALTLLALLLAGCKPSGAAGHQPPAPATTGPTPSPLVVSIEQHQLAPVVAELLDIRGGSAL